MDRKVMIGVAMVAGAVLGVLGVELLNDAAAANVPLGTASSSQAEITNGQFYILPDAGIRMELCGRTRLVEDGGVVSIIHGQSPCSPVEPGAAAAPFLNFLQGAGLNVWKNAHGL